MFNYVTSTYYAINLTSIKGSTHIIGVYSEDWLARRHVCFRQRRQWWQHHLRFTSRWWDPVGAQIATSCGRVPNGRQSALCTQREGLHLPSLLHPLSVCLHSAMPRLRTTIDVLMMKTWLRLQYNLCYCRYSLIQKYKRGQFFHPVHHSSVPRFLPCGWHWRTL